MTLTITVHGLPAPQGSKRFLGTRGGKGIMVESSKQVKPWREAVKWAALHSGEARTVNLDLRPLPMRGPLSATMVFTLPKPKSCPRSRMWPDRKPDLSKLVRSTEDALVDAGVIDDDARIVECVSMKVFPRSGTTDCLDSPGCVIRIKTL